MFKKVFVLLGISTMTLALTACSMGPVATPTIKTYALDQLPPAPLTSLNTNRSIVVMPMVATRGFDNSNMIYQTQPFQLDSFAENTWVAPPASMLTTLLSRSLQNSGAFRAVVAGPSISNTGFSVNSILLGLYQDFSVTPSQIVLSIDVDLVQNSNNKVIKDQLFQSRVPAKADTPYGGVVAANQAAADVMGQITNMVIKAVQQQNQSGS